MAIHIDWMVQQDKVFFSGKGMDEVSLDTDNGFKAALGESFQ